MNESLFRSLADGILRPRRYNAPFENLRIHDRPYTCNLRDFHDDLEFYLHGYRPKTIDPNEGRVLTTYRDRRVIYL